MSLRSAIATAAGVGFIAATALASTAETSMEGGFEAVYRASLLYLSEARETSRKYLVQMEDPSGIVRLTYSDEGFVDRNSLVEVVELDGENVKLRVTLPSDFSGRAQLLLDRIKKFAEARLKGSGGKELPHSAAAVYRSIKRFVLKNYLTEGLKREEVILEEKEAIGFLRVSLRDKVVTEPNIMIDVLPLGASRSRVSVVTTSGSNANRIWLEEKLMRAVQDDLADKTLPQESK